MDDVYPSFWDKVPKDLELLADPANSTVNILEYAKKENWPVLYEDLKRLDTFFVAGFKSLAFHCNLKLLLAKNDDKGRGILHLLLEEDGGDPALKLNIFVRLLRVGISLHQKDELGRTPAHIACDKGAWTFCRWLVYCRPYLDMKDEKGRLPVDALDEYFMLGGSDMTDEAKELKTMMTSRRPKVSFVKLAANQEYWPALFSVCRLGNYFEGEWEERFNGRTAMEWLEHLRSFKGEAELKFRLELYH